MRHDSILGLIGNTPLVGVHELSPKPEVRIWAKLEGQNPGGSSKDRIALKMIELAEEDGALTPGATILEPSSGNTGIGLALVAKLRGYKLRVVLPENVSPERRQLLEIFGAEVTTSPGAEGSNGAIRLAQELAAADPDLYMPMQYANEANPRVHQETTGPEILAEVPDLDVFVAGLGTGGTLTGVGRYLKGERPDISVVAAEPLPGELVSGLRSLDDGYVPPVLDASVLDDRFLVSNRDAVIGVRRLMREEGLFAGLSSGAVLSVALKVASEMQAGTIVLLLADGGWKYLSTGLWTRDLVDLADEFEGTILW